MKFITRSFLLLLPSVFLRNAYGQTSSNMAAADARKSCYIDELKNKGEVFTHLGSPAYYKGGSDGLREMLTKNISSGKIIATLTSEEKLYSDTAIVRFIISQDRTMSDLSIRGTQKDVFSQEIGRVLKESACSWKPANACGRLVDYRKEMKIFYTIDRRENRVSVTAGFADIDPQ